MKKAQVIIGANYGDEGKGKTVDYCCRRNENSIVVRFNSGAQAGHTVINKDGIKHVFGHFCSGSFQGVPTFLSHYFTVNPIIYVQEKQELLDKGIYPLLYVDPECLITTPYDMLINQIVETYRAGERHGSCGLGFYETLVRCNTPRYCLRVKDLLREFSKTNSTLHSCLEQIRDVYVPKRLQELKIARIPDEFQTILDSDILLQNYLSNLYEFFLTSRTITFQEIIQKHSNIIFEGAQGLMLDADYPGFPYVTPSKTGIHNVLNLMKETETEIDIIEVIYITRCYITRHGAGPLKGELDYLPYPNVRDDTNQPNRYQGTLRFAYLDLDLLKKNINHDWEEAILENTIITRSLAINCLDQIDETIFFVEGGQKRANQVKDFLKQLEKMLPMERYYLSWSD